MTKTDFIKASDIQDRLYEFKSAKEQIKGSKNVSLIGDRIFSLSSKIFVGRKEKDDALVKLIEDFTAAANKYLNDNINRLEREFYAL